MEAERKHHCRSCGEGFCHPCSSHRMPVPERGWGSGPVRVCKACYQQGTPADASSQGESSLVCLRSPLISPEKDSFVFSKKLVEATCLSVIDCGDILL